MGGGRYGNPRDAGGALEARIEDKEPRRRDRLVLGREPAGAGAIGYNWRAMPSIDPITPERAAIDRALTRIARRLRLNQALHAASLSAGLVLVCLVAWRALRWLGDGAPAAGALVILLAILGGIALASLAGWTLVAGRGGARRAAAEADRRAALRDELTSAWWFLQHEPRSEWIAAHLRHAAATARALHPAQLIPLRVSGSALAGLGAATVVLTLLWAAPPLGPASAEAGNGLLTPAELEQVRVLRELAQDVPDSAAAQRLRATLETLASTAAAPAEQRRALEQAQAAVEQMRMEAAASREGLQRLSAALGDQPGMEAVAQALAKGDAAKAAQLLAQMQPPAGHGETAAPNAGERADGAGNKGVDQLLHEATQASGALDQDSGAQQARQEAVQRLQEIARELAATEAVNEAWQRMRGSQLATGESRELMASRFAQQATAPSMSSPGTGDTPMEGGNMFRTAAVAEGDGRTQQEGGTRAGEAMGEAPADPLLGTRAERLEAQLQRQALTGHSESDAQPEQDQPWYYSASRQQQSLTRLAGVQARTRFAAAQAGGGEGISIQHRQIVKDYFMKPSTRSSEAAR